MDTVVSATDARVHFGELMRQVMETGKAVTVERGGKPAVVVVPVEEYEQLNAALRRQRWEDWHSDWTLFMRLSELNGRPRRARHRRTHPPRCMKNEIRTSGTRFMLCIDANIIVPYVTAHSTRTRPARVERLARCARGVRRPGARVL